MLLVRTALIEARNFLRALNRRKLTKLESKLREASSPSSRVIYKHLTRVMIYIDKK